MSRRPRPRPRPRARAGRRPGRRAVVALLALGVAGALLASCSSSTDDAQRASRSALDATASLSTTTTTTKAPPACDPNQSLTPMTPLPAPAQLPRGGALAAIQARGQLVAGVDLNTLLLSYQDPRTGTLQGFEIDLLHRLARAIFGDDDNRLRFVALTTAERTDAVAAGKVDIVADAITVTCARVAQVAFSGQYYRAQQRVLVPTSSGVQRMSDLKGKPVCATKGSTSVAAIIAAEGKPYEVATRIECLVALQENKVAAVTSDDTILAGLQAQDPFTKIVGGDLGDQPYAMAVKKDAQHQDLVRLVNGVLEQMRADGSWTQLYDQWLAPYTKAPAQQPTPDYRG